MYCTPSAHTRIECSSFFFSSRRRHTRFDCDWSSDVCSSDLTADLEPPAQPTTRPAAAAANDLLAPRMQLKQVRAVGRVLVNSKKLHVRAESLERSEERRVGKER